ncbi:MAG: M10 family metallopeptidase C-terminal domain-containing protein [Heteroscytonema crispum UTEX LB 1556]
MPILQSPLATAIAPILTPSITQLLRAGNDRITGGAGNDRLTGGAGSDRFVISSGFGTDTITDFTKGQDLIELSGGLSFGQLTITQGTNSNRSNALIAFNNGTSTEMLAINSATGASQHPHCY